MTSQYKELKQCTLITQICPPLKISGKYFFLNLKLKGQQVIINLEEEKRTKKGSRSGLQGTKGTKLHNIIDGAE